MDVRRRRLGVFWGSICNPPVIPINVHVPPTLDLQLGVVRVYGTGRCPSRGGSGEGMGGGWKA